MKQPKSQQAASTPPKLTLFTLPPKLPDTPGFPTPPLQTPGTVPFQWEEAPGRPIRSQAASSCIEDDNHKPKHVRSLDLPPRMITSSCTPSPTLTTVLDSQCNRTLSSTWSFRKLSTGRSDGGISGGIKKMVIESCKINSKQRSVSSPAAEYGTRSSWRWGGGGSAKVNKEEDSPNFNIVDDHLNEVADMSTIDEVIRVKVLKKVKRKGSFFSTRSHFWARVQESVHEGLKQVAVPWRRSPKAGQHWK